jgi:hypothetical protein
MTYYIFLLMHLRNKDEVFCPCKALVTTIALAVHEIKFILYYKTTQLIRYSYDLQIKNVL